jgi:DNA polymerase III gamma/tau subunit
MENFLVSARKYRPDTFDTVVGQPVITSTLKSAILSGHLAHAYLLDPGSGKPHAHVCQNNRTKADAE